MTGTVDRRTLFREVNARIRDINDGFGLDLGSYELLCECGTTDCIERLTVPVAAYESVVRDGGRYLVLPGHENASDRVTQVDVDYLVVAAQPSVARRTASRVLGFAGADLTPDA